MSSDESEDFNLANDDNSGSDFGEISVPKSKAKPKAAAKPKPTSKTTKAAPKPKATAAKSKSKPLTDRDENQADSDNNSEAEDVLTELPASKPPTTTNGPAGSKKKTASETYQKLSQLEHVLKRPDTYIGSVEAIRQFMWIFDKEKKTMVNKEISFVPGLYKIVDEILVNAADNKQRDDSMDTLKVTIDSEKNIISVMNNGKGIPIEIHETEQIYIPELIFGHLLAGSNFDDEEKKTTGGRNGYGAKLANIYSTEFIVEAADKQTAKKYKQIFKNNMSVKEKPKITENKKGEEYTKISFKPDLVKFNLPAENGLAGDMEALISKRVYDMAGTLRNVKVWLNDERIKLTGFKKYVEMYTSGVNEAIKGSAAKALEAPGSPGNGATKTPIIYEECGKRWEIAFAPSDGQFQQVSFCNSIATTKGGTHVEHIVKQLVEKIIESVNKKKAKLTLKPYQVRNHLWVFVNCLIENPTFDSQTKENMTLGMSKFGSKCVMTEEFMKKVMKSGVIDSVMDFAKFKEEAALKKTDGSKRSRITGIVKLEDANNAGTRKAADCTLILTEGDSAKSLAVAGLSVIGRDNYGVFPLRGKLLNVREASGAQLLNNAEIQHIKQIMGLQQGKKYASRDSLRYGSLMIMTDQDHDGSHIKGLIINFLDYFFPSLLEIPGFLVEFITPIVKVTRKKEELSFFTMPEFEKWKEENDDGRGWTSKYYKGLGTSDAKDAKKYFSRMSSHRIKFAPTQENDRHLIDMAFNKKKADDRKEWLRGFEPGTHLDQNVSQITYTEFINKELILFSMADNIRSIPSMVDGFKPGQRKVLFACFKRKLKAEIKVAQLGGYCSEHSAYHHGEASLTQTIVGLAQNFVGSNNINVLSPNGQFGTRASGGKDAASARYIFTNVEKITRVIFPPADDNVLNYLTDDGTQIEPEWYIPILPMVLVNGSSGIGTGWSSDIPNYNPVDIVNNLRRRLANEPMEPMHPWFRGFTGQITSEAPGKYKVLGEWDQPDEDTIEITELPVRVWNQSYKEQIEAWINSTDKIPALVKDYREYHTETTVHFIISLTERGKDAIKKEGIEKVFKLSANLSITNMVCFDPSGKIKKYSTPEQILDDFYDVRLAYYQKRKEYLVNDLTLMYERLSNQARFVLMIIEKKLVVSNRKKAEIVAELRKLEFRPFPVKAKPKTAGDPDQADEEGVEEEEVADLKAAGTAGDFDYLLGMAISRLTAEQVAKLLAERDDKEKELQILLEKTAEDLWHADLDLFEQEWRRLMTSDNDSRRASIKKVKPLGFKPSNAAKGKGKKPAAKVELNSDGEEDFKPNIDKKPAKPKAGTQSKLDFKPVTGAAAKPESTEESKPGKPSGSLQASTTTKKTKRDASELDDDQKQTSKAPAKKKKAASVKSDDYSEDDFEISVKSKPTTKSVKSSGSTSQVSKEDEAESKAKKKPAPKTTATATKKLTKPASSSSKATKAKPASNPRKRAKMISDDDDDDSGDSDIRKLALANDDDDDSQEEAEEEDDEDDDDDSVVVAKPSKKTVPAPKKRVVSGSSTVASKKPSSSITKPAPKKKKEEEEEEEEEVAPIRRPARATKTRPKSYKLKAISSDEDDDNDSGSQFNEDDDE
ncbi:DNA topoisomerase 2 [Puccinia graminis f. sp. tritici]|uniref:DNA topoisomerase 2 n=1 Tax=Puccinia graminis f. sp. tritici TaxID=56615 RepID=A0A5B0PYB5_PUCGR|nr:DNA topoisomerase 2 [Puccinia graminis f. sp. tritici]KAA1131644.1 DNA topoisomerase 2 [Puccinia graminis f. sp. tritici]